MDTEPAPKLPRNPGLRRPKAAASRSAVAEWHEAHCRRRQNSAEYRQYRDVVIDLVDHLGSDATVVQRAICEEAAGLIVWCRDARLALLQAMPHSTSAHTRLRQTALRRLLEDIGQDAAIARHHARLARLSRAEGWP